MKKFTAMFLTMMMVVAMTGCGSDVENVISTSVQSDNIVSESADPVVTEIEATEAAEVLSPVEEEVVVEAETEEVKEEEITAEDETTSEEETEEVVEETASVSEKESAKQENTSAKKTTSTEKKETVTVTESAAEDSVADTTPAETTPAPVQNTQTVTEQTTETTTEQPATQNTSSVETAPAPATETASTPTTETAQVTSTETTTNTTTENPNPIRDDTDKDPSLVAALDDALANYQGSNVTGDVNGNYYYGDTRYDTEEEATAAMEAATNALREATWAYEANGACQHLHLGVDENGEYCIDCGVRNPFD